MHKAWLELAKSVPGSGGASQGRGPGIAGLVLALAFGVASDAESQPLPLDVVPSPSSVDFGRVRRGSVADAVEVTLTNTSAVVGATDLTYTWLPDVGPFTLSGTEVVIPPSGVVVFVAGCSPSEPDEASRTLRISWSGGGSPPVDLLFHCLTPGLWVETPVDPYDFGSRELGLTTSVHQFTVTNDFLGAVQMAALERIGAACDEFSVAAAAPLPTSLAAGAATVVSVTATPQALGPRSCELVLRDDVGAVVDTTLGLRVTGEDWTPPTAPGSVTSSSHGDGQPKLDPTIEVGWGPAVDSGSGVDGYGLVFDQEAFTACPAVLAVEEDVLAAVSGELTAGAWYFHVCAVDVSGNWGPVRHGGPYSISDGPELLFSDGFEGGTASRWQVVPP